MVGAVECSREQAAEPFSIRQVKLGIVAENIGKLGLAVATICFIAQTIIWLVSMGQEVRAVCCFSPLVSNPPDRFSACPSTIMPAS